VEYNDIIYQLIIKNVMNKMEKIKMLVMDVDGTLTDGKIYMGQDGEIFKVFNVKDGYAIHELLPKYNIVPVIITGRISRIVENRAKEIGIKHIYQSVEDKIGLLKKLVQEMKGRFILYLDIRLFCLLINLET